jgi:hypothetical protein
MDEDAKQELTELRRLVVDNNRMLQGMRRMQRFSFLLRVIVWLAVILLPLYFYQQYLEPIVGGASSGFFGFPSSDQIQNLINSYQAGQGQ